MSLKCPSCGNQVPLPDDVKGFLAKEARIEEALADERMIGVRLGATLSHRMEQLRAALRENDRLRKRLNQVAASRGRTPESAWNQKGRPGYERWLRMFRIKNTPRLKALQASRQATA